MIDILHQYCFAYSRIPFPGNSFLLEQTINHITPRRCTGPEDSSVAKSLHKTFQELMVLHFVSVSVHSATRWTTTKAGWYVLWYVLPVPFSILPLDD